MDEIFIEHDYSGENEPELRTSHEDITELFGKPMTNREKEGLVVGLCGIGFLAALALAGAIQVYQHYFQPHPQTRDVIGNPNAKDPNDTLIDYKGQRFYRIIDGMPVEDYIRAQEQKR